MLSMSKEEKNYLNAAIELMNNFKVKWFCFIGYERRYSGL